MKYADFSIHDKMIYEGLFYGDGWNLVSPDGSLTYLKEELVSMKRDVADQVSTVFWRMEEEDNEFGDGRKAILAQLIDGRYVFCAEDFFLSFDSDYQNFVASDLETLLRYAMEPDEAERAREAMSQ